MKLLSVTLAAFSLLGALALGGCRSTPKVERAAAAENLARAEDEIAAGELQAALERLVGVRAVIGLDPDVRARCEGLLVDCARVLLERYAGADFDSDDLLQLYELELPTGLRARAGILAADRMIDEGRRVAAFKQIKEVDEELPNHPERVLGGDVLARAGLSLIRDDRRYYVFFSYRERGREALEYLVLRYPMNAACPEAYAELAKRYEAKGDYDSAIARHEDLLIYHPGSDFSVWSEFSLPRLRLERLRRDDYDRRELTQARDDVARWLVRHAGHELEPEVRALQVEVKRRLVASDLGLARYYDRIHSPFGARIHAERALREAESADLDEDATVARALLASLPADAGSDWTIEVAEPPDAGAEPKP